MKNIESFHPCFKRTKTEGGGSVIHAPIATKCYTQCLYCSYSVHQNIAHGDLPGVASKCLQNDADLTEYLEGKTRKQPNARIIGVSGPGDILADLSVLSNFLSVAAHRFPDHKLCLCTSGLGFDAAESILIDAPQLSFISFTVNTLRPETAALIYFAESNLISQAEALLAQQQRAVRVCVAAGLRVKINTVFLPGLNADEIGALFGYYSDLGVSVLNLTQYKPGDRRNLPHLQYPRTEYAQRLKSKRKELCRAGLRLKTNCRQCRSDYSGEV